MTDWSTPQEVNDLVLAFPAHVIGTLLPPLDEIPAEFLNDNTVWSSIANSIFAGVEITDAPPFGTDHDPELIRRHISACLGSFEPKHEHKIAGVAWLLSLWFTKPSDDNGSST